MIKVPTNQNGSWFTVFTSFRFMERAFSQRKHKVFQAKGKHFLAFSAIQTVGEGKEPAGGAWGAEREGLQSSSIKQAFCIANGRMWQVPLTMVSLRRHKRTVARRAGPILLRQTISPLTGEPARCSKESGNCFPTEVPMGIGAETMELSLFYKGFAHLVDFLARAYGHFGFRHPGWEVQLQGFQ
jgi:hypothetical protein